MNNKILVLIAAMIIIVGTIPFLLMSDAFLCWRFKGRVEEYLKNAEILSIPARAGSLDEDTWQLLRKLVGRGAFVKRKYIFKGEMSSADFGAKFGKFRDDVERVFNERDLKVFAVFTRGGPLNTRGPWSDKMRFAFRCIIPSHYEVSIRKCLDKHFEIEEALDDFSDDEIR